ncbi:DUF1963 domain-containing protein [Pararhizobium sp.]|uniref:DUF1963 domain-containing protein n=1 Tax=Pararhizobium sp. TaxID=1977563 RepID=UPI00271A8977|nr:DUF1963 domain-containing protein [Pararhizobium sp.]MDO9417292.1 DUF1963 domain-containing protein [Pararhizobium sp.]
MAGLTAHTLTGFLADLLGAAGLHAVYAIDVALDFVLISRIGVLPAADVLAVLTFVFPLAVYRSAAGEATLASRLAGGSASRKGRALRRRRMAVGVTDGGAETVPVRTAVAGLLAEIRNGIRHDNQLHFDDRQPSLAVRLAPQIPIRDHADPQSWLGGEPRMSPDVAWPEIDGCPAYFLAQIDCASLPSDLWDGSGPRHGWLAFFVHPKSTKTCVLHLDRRGPARTGPEPVAYSWFDPLRPELLSGMHILAPPRWPVDLVAAGSDQAGPHRTAKARSAAISARHDAGYDLAAPENQPFDWPSVLSMLQMMETRLAASLARTPDVISRHRDRLECLLRDLPATKASRSAFQKEADFLAVLIKASEEARAMLEHAVVRAGEIAALGRDLAVRVPFSPGALAPVMEGLQAIELMTMRRPAAQAGASLLETGTIPLTVHSPLSNLWVNDFDSVRRDSAKRAYCTAPEALPLPVRLNLEALWRDEADHEVAVMGGDRDASPDSDVTLLELPYSNLMGWMFGHVENLSFTIKRSDLAAGTFDNVTAQFVG